MNLFFMTDYPVSTTKLMKLSLSSKRSHIKKVNTDLRSPFFRADSETRTRDLRITNALLYQLSYSGICGAKVYKILIR